MGVLTEYFLVHDDDAALSVLGEGPEVVWREQADDVAGPLDGRPWCVNGVLPQVVIDLAERVAEASGVPLPPGSDADEPVAAVDEQEGPWLSVLPAAVVWALHSEVPDEVLVEWWEENLYELEDGGVPDEVQQLLALVRRVKPGQRLYAWVCL